MFAVLVVALSATCADLAIAECKLVKIHEWQFAPDKASLIIDGAINGQKIGVRLDTGAYGSFVMRAAADRLGLTRLQGEGIASGVGGNSVIENVVIDEFRIGTATLKNWKAPVVGERDLGPEYSVLLGYDYFQQTDVEFDLPNNAIRFFQAVDCGKRWLAYWAKPGAAGLVNLKREEFPRSIVFPAKLNGQSLDATLDTGANSTYVSQRMAMYLGITAQTPGVAIVERGYGIGSRSVETWTAPFESFAIGDEIIRNPVIGVLDLRIRNLPSTLLTYTGNLDDMILGLDFLRSHRVLIAHSQNQVYFTYVGGRVFTPPKPH
jgi:hypothetical protein